MSILVNTGFKVGSAAPLNEYSIRETVADRDALVTNGYVYEGMEVYCKDTKIKYRWTGVTWNEIGSGGTVDLSGYAKTYTSLDELGLTAPVTVGEIFNAMPSKTMAVISCEAKDEAYGTVTVSDIPESYGILTIKKNGVGRLSIEYQNSSYNTACNVKKWIGTLKGADGTGLYWKQLSTHSTYTDLSELGLNSTATLKDITKTMANNSMIAIKVDAMADQSEYNDIVQGTVTIYKVEDSRIQAIMTDKATGRTWIGIIGGENTIIGWKRVVTETEITNELTNTSTINQIPNASIVGGEIHGKFIDTAVYSDALAMPIGKWRVDSNAKASQMQNLPVSKAGILEVKYLQGSDGTTAFTGTFKYAMLTYTAIDGNIYKRSFNSDNTVGNIVNDTGWEKIQTGINYSTTEQAVGTWIDGRTVYRKVFTIDSVSAQTTEADVEICNLELTTQKRIISFSGAVNSIGSEGVLPYAYFPNNFQFFSYLQNDRVYFKGTWKYPLNTIRIIVEYIK